MRALLIWPGLDMSSSPASTPKIMVAIDGMKLRVAYPPGLKAERLVARPREQVEEPAIEVRRDVGVLVPVGKKSAHEERGSLAPKETVTKLGAGQWVEREEQPIGERGSAIAAAS